jgi:hypothetical protein
MQAVQLSSGENSEWISYFIKFIFPVNDSNCVLEDRNLWNIATPGTVGEARKLMKTFGVSTAEVEIVVSLMNNGCSELFSGSVPHLTTGKLSRRSLANWNPTPLIKSPLKQGHNNGDDTSVRKKGKPK